MVGLCSTRRFTKHPTAIAVVKLQERGALSIDDRLGEHVPDVPATWRGVTLRQLLTHTSGIPDYEAVVGYDFYEANGGFVEIVTAVGGLPLDFEPGTSFSYSNTGYYLLSRVIEQVSGAGFADFMAREIFEPAGMTDSSIGGEDSARRVVGFRSVDGTATPVHPIRASTTLGAGALVSTVEDWGRWQQALNAGRVVSPTSRDLAYTPTRLASGQEVAYGLGMIVDRYRGARRRMHTGLTPGFASRYEWYPDRGMSFLVLANHHDARLGALSQAVALAAVPGLDYRSLGIPNDPDPARTSRARTALEQAVLGEGPLGLLDESMHAFARDDAYAPLRASVAPAVRAIERFRYLRTDARGDSGPERIVYEARGPEGVLFWTMTFREGLLAGLNWEER
jgi:CubicO group peptidase (beta-lactamase class C family)